MRKFIALCAAAALLTTQSTIATAATASSIVTCMDGTKGHAGQGACSDHGGLKKAKTAAPIDTTKGFGPNPTSSKSKTASVAKKKSVAKATHDPTARCKDGAMYFSTGRRGACAKHGGVAMWY